jgi:Fur family peroxide stress response transcriptional regulator
VAQTQSLTESLHTRGRRVTRQRQLVMQVLQDNPGHLEVEAVYALAKASDPNISLPTVYRALAVLKEMGLVEDHTLGEDHVHFEAAPETPHYHFTCQNCGQVIEFDAPQIMQVAQDLSKREGLQVTKVHLLLRGYCAKCQTGGAHAKP